MQNPLNVFMGSQAYSSYCLSSVIVSYADAISSNKPLWSLLFKDHNVVHILCSVADSNRNKLLAELSMVWLVRLAACVCRVDLSMNS